MNIADIINLSELLAQMAQIKRGTKLPNGEFEPDSHHAFSLALIAYQVCASENLQLDTEKVVLYALAHDLLEIITGDEDTLHATPDQLADKQSREQQALTEFDTVFARYPALRQAMYDYEKLDTPEAATVFVLDKACPAWTHHVDNGLHARQKGLVTVEQVDQWAQRKREAFSARLAAQPPERILDIFEESYQSLRALYVAEKDVE